MKREDYKIGVILKYSTDFYYIYNVTSDFIFYYYFTDDSKEFISDYMPIQTFFSTKDKVITDIFT